MPVANGDRIYAKVLSTGCSADGWKKEGFTVPSIEGQYRLLRDLYHGRRAPHGEHKNPPHLSYIEAHSAGTKAGDPVEVEALGRLVGAAGQQGNPSSPNDVSPLTWLGSLKANMGHLEGAAGIASLVKAVCVARKGQVPPQLHYSEDTENPQLRLAERGFKVPRKIEGLPGATRHVAVNSFGAGGANAHVLLVNDEGSRAPQNSTSMYPPTPTASVMLLSTKSLPSLRRLVCQYRDLLNSTTPPHLPSLIRTLLWRRSVYSHQLYLPFQDARELQMELQSSPWRPTRSSRKQW